MAEELILARLSNGEELIAKIIPGGNDEYLLIRCPRVVRIIQESNGQAAIQLVPPMLMGDDAATYKLNWSGVVIYSGKPDPAKEKYYLQSISSIALPTSGLSVVK